MTRHPAIRHLVALGVCLGVLVGGSSVLAAETAAPSGVIIVSPTGITRAVDVPTFQRKTTLPVVDLSLSPSGRGYVTLDAGGTITSYGDAARFSRQSFPRTGAIPAAIVLTQTGRGAYVGFIDGTVRALGDAPAVSGSPAGGQSKLVPPLVDVALTPDGEGLWAVRSDGSVAELGGATELADAPAGGSPAVGIASTPSGEGAWVARLNGSVAALGDAQGERGPRGSSEPRVSDIASLGEGGWALVDLVGKVEPQGGSPVALPGLGTGFVAIDSLAATTTMTAGGQGAPTSTKVITPPAILGTSGDPAGTLEVSLPCYVTGGPTPLQVGDVLAAAIGEHTPNGLLRRVLAIGACSDGALVVSTEPAALSEAIPEGSFSLSDDLSDLELPDFEPTTEDGFIEEEPSPIVAEPSRREITPSSATSASAVGTIADPGRFTYGCPADGSGLELKAKPSYNYDPDVVFDADWDGDDAFVRIGLGLQGNLSVEASATGAIACNATFSIIPNRSLGTRVFFVGPVPVVVEPKLSLAATLEGKAEAALTATASASGNVSAVLDSRSGFSGSALFTGTTDATPSGKLEASFSLKPKIGFLLYGIVAPTASASTGITATLAPCTNPNVKVELPAKATAKIEPADWLGDLLDPISNIDFDVESEFELPGSPYLLYSAHLPTPLPCEQTTTLPDGRVNEAYSQQVSIDIPDGANNPQYALAGGSILPDGLSLSASGLLAGTPESAGIYSFTVDVGHTLGSTSGLFQLTILPDSLQITTESLPSAELDEPYSATLTANRPADELVWTIPSGDLPDGITLDPDGTLSGTPTEAGFFSFTVRVQHAPAGGGGGTVEKVLSISVSGDGVAVSVTYTEFQPEPCTPISAAEGLAWWEGSRQAQLTLLAQTSPPFWGIAVTAQSGSFDELFTKIQCNDTGPVPTGDTRSGACTSDVPGSGSFEDANGGQVFVSFPPSAECEDGWTVVIPATVTRDASGVPIALVLGSYEDSYFRIQAAGTIPIAQS